MHSITIQNLFDKRLSLIASIYLFAGVVILFMFMVIEVSIWARIFMIIFGVIDISLSGFLLYMLGTLIIVDFDKQELKIRYYRYLSKIKFSIPFSDLKGLKYGNNAIILDCEKDSIVLKKFKQNHVGKKQFLEFKSFYDEISVYFQN